MKGIEIHFKNWSWSWLKKSCGEINPKMYIFNQMFHFWKCICFQVSKEKYFNFLFWKGTLHKNLTYLKKHKQEKQISKAN